MQKTEEDFFSPERTMNGPMLGGEKEPGVTVIFFRDVVRYHPIILHGKEEMVSLGTSAHQLQGR